MFFTLSARKEKKRDGTETKSIETLLKEIGIQRGVLETLGEDKIDKMREIRDSVIDAYRTIINMYEEANETLVKDEIEPLQTAYQTTLDEYIEATRELERLRSVEQDIKRRYREHLARIQITMDDTSEEETKIGEEAAFYTVLNTEIKDNRVALAHINAEMRRLKSLNVDRESRLAIVNTQRDEYTSEESAIKTQLDEFVQNYRDMEDESSPPSQVVLSIEPDVSDDPRKEKAKRIMTLLRASQYDVLKAEFSAEWQQFFLVALFALFGASKNGEPVDTQIPLLIVYMTESHGAYMPFIYETIISRRLSGEEKETRILNYLADSPIAERLENTKTKVATLVYKTVGFDRAELLRVIEALLTNKPDVFVIPTDEETRLQENIATAIVEEKRRVERLKAVVQFRHYELEGVKQPSTTQRLDENAHLYRVKDKRTGRSVVIRIEPYELGRSEQERRAYELFNKVAGFERLVNHFRLEHFPSGVFGGGGDTLFNPVHVYVTEASDVDSDILKGMATHEDRRCVLIDILYALREIKRQYGAQHNNVRAETIKININKKALSQPPRTYRLANEEKTVLECHSQYRAILVHYRFVTLKEDMDVAQRRLLSGVDYDNIRQILAHPYFIVGDELRRELYTLIERNKESIAFDTLLEVLK